MNKKDELIDILNCIKDKVVVTGSYAEGKQTVNSDIDFYIKTKPEEEIDLEARFVEDTYIRELIDCIESKSLK